jgi:hypothetical protein
MPTFEGEAKRKFDPVPEADYELTISDIREDEVSSRSKNKGATMWHIKYDIGDTGKKVFDNLVFVKNSFWKISNFWRALGREVPPGKQIDTGEPEDLIGARIQAHLGIRVYNGDPQNEIMYFIEPTSGKALVPAGPTPPTEPDNIPF